jgi:hypothetical protein
MISRTNFFICRVEALIKQVKDSRPIFSIASLSKLIRLVKFRTSRWARDTIFSSQTNLFSGDALKLIETTLAADMSDN